MPNLPQEMAFCPLSPRKGTNVPLDATPTSKLKSQLKELPINFMGRGEVRGFEFRQIAKSAQGYLYQVTQPGVPPHFEIFRRVENIRFGRISYPGSNSFGVWSWTAKDLASGLQRFENL
jgi:hypothetical protein